MSHYHEQFLKQNPLAVLGVLRDLHKTAVPLRISWSGGQLISKILTISPDKLVLDYGSQYEDNIAVLEARQITITAETQGAKVEFALEQLQQSEYLQLPAFITAPPPALWFVQRRRYFRISAPCHPPYYCQTQLPDNRTLRFRLYDLSLGGMGHYWKQQNQLDCAKACTSRRLKSIWGNGESFILTLSYSPSANTKSSMVKMRLFPLPA